MEDDELEEGKRVDGFKKSPVLLTREREGVEEEGSTVGRAEGALMHVLKATRYGNHCPQSAPSSSGLK
jgi:hypothetical protein